jgi:alpha/beta superfamily hydrolase
MVQSWAIQGYHVILWNYRGYGSSTGTPSIRRSQEDACSVYRFYRSKGYEVEIVHGYSIGGAAAVGLMEQLAKGAHQAADKVQVLIVDRSFSSIGEVLHSKLRCRSSSGEPSTT